MEDLKRSILQRVARGELNPEQGAAELEELEARMAADPAAGGIAEAAPVASAHAPRPMPTVEWVQVSSEFGSVHVIGDPSVVEAVADGPHSIKRVSGRLVIEHSPIDQAGEFFFSRRGYGADRQRLTVRMNPALSLDLESQAGSVYIRQLKGPIRTSVQAGSTTIEGFQGPLTLSSQAGSIRAQGVLTEGSSRISCQAGSVRIELEKGSSVRVRARAQLGRLRIGGIHSRRSGLLGGDEEVVVGSGQASLEVDATMGSIRVETPD